MSWDARHFHIELSDARLEGGGQLVGRVHRHGDWPSGEIAVRARCLECWRATALAARGLPHWEFETLWERHHAILIDRDSTWAPFEFDVPQWLPPAVEATTFAWRYELITQRSVRYWFDETAAITPLLHEGAALRRGRQLIRDHISSSAIAAAAGAAWISPVPQLRGHGVRRQTPTVRLDSPAARPAASRLEEPRPPHASGRHAGVRAARASPSHRGIHPGAMRGTGTHVPDADPVNRLFAATSHAGGGTRTPDTRIMIPLRFGSTSGV